MDRGYGGVAALPRGREGIPVENTKPGTNPCGVVKLDGEAASPGGLVQRKFLAVHKVPRDGRLPMSHRGLEWAVGAQRLLQECSVDCRRRRGLPVVQDGPANAKNLLS